MTENQCSLEVSFKCAPEDPSKIPGVCYECYATVAYDTDSIKFMSVEEYGALSAEKRAIIEYRGAFKVCPHCSQLIRAVDNKWSASCPACGKTVADYSALADLPRQRESGSGARDSEHYQTLE